MAFSHRTGGTIDFARQAQADKIHYDNDVSSLTSEQVQGAIDELAARPSGGSIYIPALRMYGVPSVGIYYARLSYKGDGTDNFWDYNPRIVLFKRRRRRHTIRRDTNGNPYAHRPPKGFSMSLSKKET